MSKLVFSGLAFGAAMILSGAAPASAVTLPSAALAAPAEAAMVEMVGSHGNISPDALGPRHRAHRPRWREKSSYRHRSKRHARPSYRHRSYRHARPSYHHYGPSFGFSVVVPGFAGELGGGSGHVQWCMDRYRTYDPATDTYIPRVGERAYCISPYS